MYHFLMEEHSYIHVVSNSFNEIYLFLYFQVAPGFVPFKAPISYFSIPYLRVNRREKRSLATR